MKYVYFASYTGMDPKTGQHFGSCGFDTLEPLTQIERIRQAEQEIRKSTTLEWLVFLNFQLLRTEE